MNKFPSIDDCARIIMGEPSMNEAYRLSIDEQREASESIEEKLANMATEAAALAQDREAHLARIAELEAAVQTYRHYLRRIETGDFEGAGHAKQIARAALAKGVA
jgi:hypothetical protein